MEQPVEADESVALGLEHLGRAADVVGPGDVWVPLDGIEVEGARAGQVERIDDDPPVGARADGQPGVAVDRHRQDVAVVVVGVTAHEVHASRGPVPGLRRAAIPLREGARHDLPARTGIEARPLLAFHV